MDFFDTYYLIYKHIINNYENKTKNFEVLKNMEDISVYIKDSMNKIDTIIKETNIKISFSKLIDIYMSMNLNDNKGDIKNEVLNNNNKNDVLIPTPSEIIISPKKPFLSNSSIQSKIPIISDVSKPPINSPSFDPKLSSSIITMSKASSSLGVSISKEEELICKIKALKKVPKLKYNPEVSQSSSKYTYHPINIEKLNNNKYNNLITNSTIDKYENFELNNIKGTVLYYNVWRVLIMNNTTILVFIHEISQGKNNKSILGLFNGNRYKEVCKFEKDYFICYMIQMYDDNIIAMFHNSKSLDYFLKIFKINEAKMEIIQTYKWEKEQKMYKLFENKIFFFHNKDYPNIYQYQKEKLIDYEFPIKYYTHNICEINKNEFVIYCLTKGKIYGNNDSLIFYNIQTKTETNIIKIGDHNEFDDHDISCPRFLKLLNDKNLILRYDHYFYLIDLHKRKIRKKLKNPYVFNIDSMIVLNEKNFLISKYNKFEQYIIDDKNNAILKGEVSHSYGHINYLNKFPGKKLLIRDGDNLLIIK